MNLAARKPVRLVSLRSGKSQDGALGSNPSRNDESDGQGAKRIANERETGCERKGVNESPRCRNIPETLEWSNALRVRETGLLDITWWIYDFCTRSSSPVGRTPKCQSLLPQVALRSREFGPFCS